MPATVHVFDTARTVATERLPVCDLGRARARGWLKFVAHEPFFQFIVLGLLIWAGVEYWSARDDRYTIHLVSADRQRIATTYLQRFGEMPTPAQLQGLIDGYVREEIFLREGLALHLDKDDEIVRRRIVQKYEFLQTDLAVSDAPTPAVLERWFNQNRLRYMSPERIAFSQVYFSVDQDGEQRSKRRALRVLKQLRRSGMTRAPGLGDSFPGPSDVAALGPEEAQRLFGQSDLSEQLFNMPLGRWIGPFRSGYGWHLVYVTGHCPSVLPPLSEIRDRVLADYMEEQRRSLNAQAFENLRAKYKVQYDGGVR